MPMTQISSLLDPAVLERIAGALERLSPPAEPKADFQAADCFVWTPETLTLEPVARVNRVPLSSARQ